MMLNAMLGIPHRHRSCAALVLFLMGIAGLDTD